ncbi:CULLIN-2 domain-containing protein [Mycena indigotica]|uniref:CULLIN-2 domain-containing protein n=1 Tax=Mycena indigotica TaxID=2126181 RepID=A0A8H6SVD4_9AGAR|nr:CULLIN-2 domain-containing protein [Mycena indigotica]KAF7306598.1 CULLIN-2 domain-containing protein [Mycena indigotica]
MSVKQLLGFPKSNGFSALPSSIAEPSSATGATRAREPTRIRASGPEAPIAKPPPDARNFVRRVLEGETTRFTYESAYGACFYSVCVEDNGAQLYQRVKEELNRTTTQLRGDIYAMEAPKDADDAEKWIAKFVDKCTSFEKQVALLQSLFTHLDQVYARRTQNASIREVAFSSFSNSIFTERRMVEALHNSVRILVNADREVGSKKTDRIPALIGHLRTHKQFSSFEIRYRDAAWDFYEKDSEEFRKKHKDEPKLFFEHVRTQLKNEVDRSEKLLPLGSWNMVREAALKAMLSGKMVWIAEGALGSYLDAQDFENLKLMNEFFSVADGSKLMCDAFKSYILKSVQAIVRNQTEDDKMVERLLKLHSLANKAIQQCFIEVPLRVTQADTDVQSTSSVPATRPKQDFVYALADAFQMGFRARRNKPAEMIARYLDKLMRKGQGSQSNAQYEAQLDHVLGLYRYTDDKDVFRGFYLRALSKRLLLEKHASTDFEIAVLNKLKKEYDPEFSAGAEMFSDLTLSNELISEYHRKLPLKGDGRKLKVMVLKQGAWPYSQQPQGITLPVQMQEQLNKFELFYKAKHKGRTLHWQSSVSTMTLVGHFQEKKELSVSLFQGTILLLFNDTSTLSLTDIAEATELEDGLLRLTLQSLACGKKRVLRKEPVGKDINDGDIFHFNERFTDPSLKVHINSIQAKVSAEESKQTQNAIDGERNASLDAAIVRIMKSKKEIMHPALLTAVIDAVKSHFTPDVSTIKGRIEKLIEQEYMRRDEVQQQKFIYVA